MMRSNSLAIAATGRFSPPWWCQNRASLFLLALAMGAQGFSAAHMGAFWIDEAGSVAMAHLPLGALWQQLRFDSFPLGHFLLLKAWLWVFGAWGEVPALRLLGFLLGSATVAAFWWASKRLSGAPPLLSLALLGFSPLVVRYLGTSRPYGFSTLLLLLTLTFALVFLQNGARSAFWWGALSAFLAAHTHYLNSVGLLVVALALGLAPASAPRRLPAVLAAIFLAMLSLLVYWPTLRFAMRTWSFMLGNPTLDAPGAALNFLLLLFPREPLLPLLWLIFGACFVLGAFKIASKPGLAPEMRVALVLALGAPALYAAFFLVAKTNVSMWYFLSPLVLAAVGIEAVIQNARAQLPSRAQARVGAGITVFSLLIVAAQCNAGARVWKAPMSSMDEVARQIERRARPGDLVVISPWQWTLSFGAAYRGDGAAMRVPAMRVPVVRVPDIAQPQFMRWDLARRIAETRDPLPPTFARLEAALRGGHRLFVVTGDAYFRDERAKFLAPHRIDASHTIEDFNRSWGDRTARWLQKSARRATRVVAKRQGIGFEKPELWIYSGWKNPATGATGATGVER